MKTRVSVVVTTVDHDAGRLFPVLERWMELLELHRDTELIVVNDGGSYGAAWTDRLPSFGHQIRYAYLDPMSSTFRLAQARNLGVMLSRCSDRVCFTDSDCIPCHSFIDQHKVVPKNGIGIGLRKRMYGHGPVAEFVDAVFCPTQAKLEEYTYRDDERLDEARPVGWRGCEHVWGCNFSVPVGTLLESGGFDEEVQGWGGEDVNLADRMLRHAGLDVVVLPTCYVYHMDHPARAERSTHPFGKRGQPFVANGRPLVRMDD